MRRNLRMPWVSVDVFLLICPSLLLHSSFSTCEDETSGNAGCTAVCYVLPYFTLQNAPKNRTFEVDRWYVLISWGSCYVVWFPKLSRCMPVIKYCLHDEFFVCMIWCWYTVDACEILVSLDSELYIFFKKKCVKCSIRSTNGFIFRSMNLRLLRARFVYALMTVVGYELLKVLNPHRETHKSIWT
jgi:hypothetical protein